MRAHVAPRLALGRTRRSAGIVAVAALMMTGCMHYHYYGNALPVGMSPCAPESITYGAVCDVPPATISGGPPTIISGGSSRTIVSRPRTSTGEPKLSLSGSEGGWKRVDPDNVATTRVNGALDGDETVKR